MNHLLFALGKSLLTLCVVLLLGHSCAKQAPEQGKMVFDEANVNREVTAAVWAFHAADTSRNAQAVIDLLWPEYTMLVDGNRITYSDVAAGSPAFMEGLDMFYTEWTDLQIIPISDKAALTSFLFRDSLVHKDGVVTKKRGPNTFLWEKRGDEWRVRYGDADHYPWE